MIKEEKPKMTWADFCSTLSNAECSDEARLRRMDMRERVMGWFVNLIAVVLIFMAADMLWMAWKISTSMRALSHVIH